MGPDTGILLKNGKMSDKKFNKKVNYLTKLLDKAESILIGAGSGLSVDAGIDYFDETSFAKEFVPTCPNCGGPVFFNVRADSSFVEEPYIDGYDAFIKWILENKKKRLLLLEIGTGFHTPVWIRWPFEKITSENKNSHLVRINSKDLDIPENIKSRSISFQCRTIELIKAAKNKLKHEEKTQ